MYEGYQHEYNELLQGMSSNEFPKNVAVFVWEVLKMYRILNNSYLELSEEEKQQIDIEDIKFEGFDGNEEGDYYVYAKFILEDMGKYRDIYKNGELELNSHSRRVDQYKTMLARWKEVRTSEYGSLSLNKIKYIIEWYK